MSPTNANRPWKPEVGSGLQGRCGGVSAGGASGTDVIGRDAQTWSDLAERWMNRARCLTACLRGQLTPTGCTAVSTWSAEYGTTGASVPNTSSVWMKRCSPIDCALVIPSSMICAAVNTFASSA
jgi:hypothetical protein